MILYLQDSHKPAAGHDTVPGQWVARDAWPPKDVTMVPFHPTADRLGQTPEKGVQPLSTPQTLGHRSGRWFSFGTGPDLPTDQRPDDMAALCFDTPPSGGHTDNRCPGAAPALSV